MMAHSASGDPSLVESECSINSYNDLEFYAQLTKRLDFEGDESINVANADETPSNTTPSNTLKTTITGRLRFSGIPQTRL
jgi:hypothetical protein